MVQPVTLLVTYCKSICIRLHIVLMICNFFYFYTQKNPTCKDWAWCLEWRLPAFTDFVLLIGFYFTMRHPFCLQKRTIAYSCYFCGVHGVLVKYQRIMFNVRYAKAIARFHFFFLAAYHD